MLLYRYKQYKTNYVVTMIDEHTYRIKYSYDSNPARWYHIDSFFNSLKDCELYIACLKQADAIHK